VSAPGLETSADRERIGKQRETVKATLLKAAAGDIWYSLVGLQAEIWMKHKVHIPLPSLSARIRDMRKQQYGGYKVERKNRGGGLYVYKLVEPEPQSTLFSKGEAQ
jgi:hypothetical protein